MAFIPAEYENIITIDFGTISTGATHANIDSLLNREPTCMGFETNAITVKKWPGQQPSEKTPSISIYDRRHNLLHWGGSAQAYIEKKGDHLSPSSRLVREKLKLEFPSSVPQEGIDHRINNVNKKKYDTMSAIIDYFTKIFDYTVDYMMEEKERKNDKIRFVITVPAQWTGAERSVMRSISKKAKLINDQDHENRLLIINESLAAALYCDLEMTDSQDMELGDKYIVCDAGGYTVKLATFECVERSENDDPIDTSFGHCQLTNSSSAECGSNFIDMKMYKLLTRFFYNGERPKDQKETDRRDRLFAPVMKKFINEYKPSFGKRSSEFEFPKCNHDKILKTCADDIYKLSLGKEFFDDDKCIICKIGDFKHLHEPDFGDSFEVKLSDPFIVPELKLYIPDVVDYKKKESVKYNKKEGVRYRKKEGVCTLVVPYSIMRTEVFNSVIRSTLNLIEQQIKKVDGDVKRIYIVGGFASSPLLQKMIFRRFYVKRNLFPRTKFRMGSLVNLGLLAVMNGAIKYGTHDAKEVPRSDIVKNEFGYTTTDEYDVLICLDIGYETTSCSYKDLTKKSGKMIDITDWPGNEKSNVFIPTAKETINGETLWGARVQDPFNRDSKKLITPSKLMALVKADFRKYLCQYLQLVLNHVHATIGSLSDKSRYRYVITTENCYPFFTDKSEMRKIVERAGIISAEDSAHRLLLIGRDHASAMYFERKYFLESDACTHHFLQINMYHDTCYLSLFESIKINHAGYRSRNVRRLKSVTFDFDFIDRAVLRLNRYVTENVCIECNDGHDTYYSFYYSDLKKGFLHFLKTNVDFSERDKIQGIQITESKCCTAVIKVYDLLEYILWPALEDLASEIHRFARQADMMLPQFNLEKIFLLGTLIETKGPATYSFLELALMKKILALTNVDVEHIVPSGGNEALLGAAQYGICPESFTERVSKHSYAVNIQAYAMKEFQKEDKDDIENKRKNGGNDLKHDVYNIESDLGAADFKQQVELFHHTKNSGLNPDHLSVFARRGDKVLEDKICKTFFAKRDCLVYATIYRSELDGLPQDESELDFSKFRKIHRFEIYLKADEDDPTVQSDNNSTRLSFDISYTVNNYEALFEAQICSVLGRKKIPDFYIRDEFLVANIYDDSQHVEIGDLKI